jgi:hypothetical protein
MFSLDVSGQPSLISLLFSTRYASLTRAWYAPLDGFWCCFLFLFRGNALCICSLSILPLTRDLRSGWLELELLTRLAWHVIVDCCHVGVPVCSIAAPATSQAGACLQSGFLNTLKSIYLQLSSITHSVRLQDDDQDKQTRRDFLLQLCG